jgi:hypothetical protein
MQIARYVLSAAFIRILCSLMPLPLSGYSTISILRSFAHA